MSHRYKWTAWRLGAAIAWACWLPAAAGAEGVPEEKETSPEPTLEELLEVEIEVATGFPQPLSEAPAVASVITAAEIEEMGATHLDEVLETVAGLHVGLAKGRGLDPVYSIRGIQSALSSQVLLLVNGVPVTQLLNGGPVLGFQLPVASIARVEVIRGPGSAIYGADAFAGVINVITKTAADLAGTEVGTRIGSFDSQNVWLAYGDVRGGWDVFFSVDRRRTDGDRGRVVERDQQTAIDELLGTHASLAPGPLDTAHELLDVHLGLARGPWTLRLWGWEKDRGLGFGVAPILDPEGRQHSSQLLADATYLRDGAEDWVFTQRVSWLAIDQESDFRIFPPGAVVPIAADGNVSFAAPDIVGFVSFPDGVIGQPGDRELHVALDSVAVYEGLDDHRFRLNGGIVLQDVDTREKKNFGPGVLDGTETVAPGTLVDVTDTEFIFLEDHERNHWYVSVQDEWSITEAWQLTAGLRFDRYSDFGSTVNPRLALVWNRRRTAVKLLYGSAFRAPSFGQLFNINNPAALGNPELDPEEITTAEVVFEVRPIRGLRGALSLFDYEIDGLIDLVPDDDEGATTSTAQNANDQEGYGFELEMEWEPGDAFRLASSFAWQRSEDEVTGARIAEAPGRHFYAGATWRERRGFKLTGQLHVISDRHRAPGDPRPPLDGYTRFDLRAARDRIFGRWDFSITARNLFDEEGREPSDPGIPGDFPLAGRAVFAEVRVYFP